MTQKQIVKNTKHGITKANGKSGKAAKHIIETQAPLPKTDDVAGAPIAAPFTEPSKIASEAATAPPVATAAPSATITPIDHVKAWKNTEEMQAAIVKSAKIERDQIMKRVAELDVVISKSEGGLKISNGSFATQATSPVARRGRPPKTVQASSPADVSTTASAPKKAKRRKGKRGNFTQEVIAATKTAKTLGELRAMMPGRKGPAISNVLHGLIADGRVQKKGKTGAFRYVATKPAA